MNTTTSATPQARTQDVVIPCLAAIDAGFMEYKNTPTRDNANAFQNLLAEAAAMLSSVPPAASAWLPMASAPVGEAAVSVDIWCSDSECRRTDCFWFEGRWCYEVFEDKYRVIPVRAPAAWMPAPTKPEFLAA